MDFMCVLYYCKREISLTSKDDNFLVDNSLREVLLILNPLFAVVSLPYVTAKAKASIFFNILYARTRFINIAYRYVKIRTLCKCKTKKGRIHFTSLSPH